VWPDPIASIDSEKLQCAFLCGLPYTQRRHHLTLLAAPVLADSRYKDSAVYFSDVIVRADSPYKVLADLQGNNNQERKNKKERDKNEKIREREMSTKKK